MAAKKYTVLVGCNIPPDNTRHEAGDEVFLTDVEARGLLDFDPPAIEHVSETREHPEWTAAHVAWARGEGEHPGAYVAPEETPEPIEEPDDVAEEPGEALTLDKGGDE